MNKANVEGSWSCLVTTLFPVILVVFFFPFLHPFIIVGLGVLLIIWSLNLLVTTIIVMIKGRMDIIPSLGIIFFCSALLIASIFYAWYPFIYLEYRPIVKTLESVCSGNAFSKNPGFKENGFNSLVISDSRNAEGKWVLYPVRLGWIPENPNDVTLVGCFDEYDTLIQTCPYSGGGSMARYQSYLSVKLVEAKTGLVIDERLFSGTEPDGCPLTTAMSGTIRGAKVLWDDIDSWVRGFVNPTSNQDGALCYKSKCFFYWEKLDFIVRPNL